MVYRYKIKKKKKTMYRKILQQSNIRCIYIYI